MAKTAIKSLVLGLLFALVAVRPALAYIDPNTGGLLFQVLATTFAVVSGFALIFSRQIRRVVARIGRRWRDLRHPRGPSTPPLDPGVAGDDDYASEED